MNLDLAPPDLAFREEVRARTPMGRHLNGRATTVLGGSSEIQRNILARTALGL